MADNTAEAAPDNLPETQETENGKPWHFQKGNQIGKEGRSAHLWNKSTKKMVFRRAVATWWRIMNGNIVNSYIDKNGKRIIVVEDLPAILTASRNLAEYAAGKPAQKIDVSISDDVERPNTLQIVLNRPTTKQERAEASRQVIELANTSEDEKK